MSTPTKSAGNGSGEKLQLNQREIEVIAMAFICISEIKEGVPQVDAKKLAKVGNYASADSARHIWKPIQKKLMAHTSGEGDGSSFIATPSTKGRGTPRKRKADGEAGGGTPTKKPRGRKASKVALKKEDIEEEDIDEELADGEV
ncbi:hypothetical protein GL218_09102 [Daldinia childiae]|uniref:uncharacterized protein n=1 Tax=Daldinia childiae TaxID=326645 RepID=UPI0014453CEE|nr:uncharacterized protein GL218_09551 [Daldinia childiae]XP_033436016.1 uncharacterized protein GL218_09527 [Daldinia childiae]XP_033436017.1 uncharacterized protein GL218_09523 [Daldinia childiae]XP_033436021.1 uncharacterized protein GL218_09519 [Daldinia childiae]XP_033439964.1 uncharacterized protein GL218_09102 [Daldinia childiae]KAF3060319.1 hypothetical protein GL218_09551 [Daldinia childiae]KAF3060355.1 hypothetical protein GL218_09527 [Daldinia childiae]KAF3060356.1 hypothetical pr